MQAIRGPVLLVTIGILFAIHQAGILSFSRTWPLLIIVIGIMKLLERAGAPAHAHPGGYAAPGSGPYGPHGTGGEPYAGSGVPPQGSGGHKA
jgi:Domain of unknown function (DUF5668)